MACSHHFSNWNSSQDHLSVLNGICLAAKLSRNRSYQRRGNEQWLIVLSGPDGLSRLNDPAIRSAGQTILRQRYLALLAESAFLRQQNADQNESRSLKTVLSSTKMTTPSSKQGGTEQQPPQAKTHRHNW
jgi:hypothetical protein